MNLMGMLKRGDKLDKAFEDLQTGMLDVLDEDGRCVRASIHTSYASITPALGPPADDPRRLLRLLGFWDGPVTGLPAAAALADLPGGMTRQLADVLVDRHLIERTAPGRYRLHDLIRAYARERAECEETPDELDRAMRRLGRWYLSRAHGAGLLIEPYRDEAPVSPDACEPTPGFLSRGEALNWCDAERDNLVAAIRQLSRLGIDDVAWQLAVTLTRYYNARKQWDDWIGTHRMALESARRCHDRYGEGRVLHSLGRALTDRGRFDDALDAYQRASVLLPHDSYRREHVWIMIGQAAVQARRGAADTAITVARDALALCGDTDDHATAVLLGLTGAILVELGQHAEGIEHLERSLVIRRSRGDKVGQALTLHNLGETYGRIRRYPEATGSLLAALELRKDLDDRFGQANTHKELGIQLASQGSFSAAREHSREALRIFEELGAPEAAAVRAWLGRVG